MKNLGKILLLLSVIISYLNATVTAKVEPIYIYAGDSATYQLTIEGKKVEKPLLLDICGNDIIGTASQTSIESINGSYQKSYILSYEFVAKKSCIVAPTEVKIDGKIELSNSVKVVVKPRLQDKNAEFLLSFITSKTSLYVGEPFTLTLLLKQRLGARAVDSKFVAPEFKGFWKKSESEATRKQDNEFITTKVVYRLAAQRAGKLTIEPAKLKIAKRSRVSNWGSFTPQVKWRTYYSNTLEMDVKPLPNNAKIMGNLKISASVDRDEVNPNEAVNLTLKVVGEGNLEDIESFKPYLSGVNVFGEKLKINSNVLTQKIVFVGDKDFVIKPFELVYFDTKTEKVRKIKTQEIAIKIVGSVSKKEPLKIQRAVKSQEKSVVIEQNYSVAVATFVVGLILGVVLMLIRTVNPKIKKRGVKFDVKNEKALLIRLLPYKDLDEKVAKIVALLEENIYTKNKMPLDKKELKEILQKYNIS